jgi:hypothetical protein
VSTLKSQIQILVNFKKNSIPMTSEVQVQTLYQTDDSASSFLTEMEDLLNDEYDSDTTESMRQLQEEIERSLNESHVSFECPFCFRFFEWGSLDCDHHACSRCDRKWCNRCTDIQLRPSSDEYDEPLIIFFENENRFFCRSCYCEEEMKNKKKFI